MLHHLYGYRVLGLERNEGNVMEACARQRKLYPDSLGDVKYILCDVGRDSADRIESILRREFPDDATDACLIGLHACGDLGASASRLFHAIRSVRLFVLISCCYHKLTVSESVRMPRREKQYFRDFPTSDCLRRVVAAHNFDLGEFLRAPFLRLACQESADKWRGMSREQHDEQSFHVLARAVLELYSQQSRRSILYFFFTVLYISYT